MTQPQVAEARCQYIELPVPEGGQEVVLESRKLGGGK
jgi:hypothetical protein